MLYTPDHTEIGVWYTDDTLTELYGKHHQAMQGQWILLSGV